jgi:hypothetical protein
MAPSGVFLLPPYPSHGLKLFCVSHLLTGGWKGKDLNPNQAMRMETNLINQPWRLPAQMIVAISKNS